jgi:hypothetical protein
MKSVHRICVTAVFVVAAFNGACVDPQPTEANSPILSTGQTAALAELPPGLAGRERYEMTATLGGYSLWPDETPCEILRFTTGTFGQYAVTSMWSYATAAAPHDPMTVANLRPVESGEELSLVIPGGRSAETIRSSPYSLAVGDTVVVAIDPANFSTEFGAYGARAESVLRVRGDHFISEFGRIRALDEEPSIEQDPTGAANRIRAAGMSAQPCPYLRESTDAHTAERLAGEEEPVHMPNVEPNEHDPRPRE